MKSNVLQMPVGRHPVWLNDFEYLVRWKGRVRRVDIRKLKPITIGDELIRSCAVPFSDVVNGLLK